MSDQPPVVSSMSVVELDDLRRQLRESQTREAEQEALNARLREALEHALVPVAALVVSGECVDAPSALEEGLKVAILTAHDEMLAVLSLTPSQALQGHDAQVLRALELADEDYNSIRANALHFPPLNNKGRWLDQATTDLGYKRRHNVKCLSLNGMREQDCDCSASLEAEGKGAGDEGQ